MIDRDNERARGAAVDAGHHCYGHNVIETWPACTICSTPIRAAAENVTVPGLWRTCGCPDLLWSAGMSGWNRRTRAEVREMERRRSEAVVALLAGGAA